jgi:hypothetical protein
MSLGKDRKDKRRGGFCHRLYSCIFGAWQSSQVSFGQFVACSRGWFIRSEEKEVTGNK